jgi:Putative Ig domain
MDFRGVEMRNAVSLMAALLVLSACSGGNDNASTATGASATGSVSGSPAISGSPPTTIQSGEAYFFKASVRSATSAALTFAIEHKPAWASFDSGTGTLSGTPTANDVGTTPGIQISVSDGQQDASLPGFSITVTAALAKDAPTISGQPITTLNINTAYVFLPTASDSIGAALEFTIQNKPSWATFDASTGELAGTPDSSHVGTYSGIVISVSDGVATTALPTFSISVTQMSTGSVTLSWTPPTTNTNGAPLTNLAGYRIYYGTNSSSLTQSLEITNPGIASFVIGNLSAAKWYFSLVSYNTANVESTLSQVVSKTITS